MSLGGKPFLYVGAGLQARPVAMGRAEAPAPTDLLNAALTG